MKKYMLSSFILSSSSRSRLLIGGSGALPVGICTDGNRDPAVCIWLVRGVGCLPGKNFSARVIAGAGCATD